MIYYEYKFDKYNSMERWDFTKNKEIMKSKNYLFIYKN